MSGKKLLSFIESLHIYDVIKHDTVIKASDSGALAVAFLKLTIRSASINAL